MEDPDEDVFFSSKHLKGIDEQDSDDDERELEMAMKSAEQK